MPFVEVRSREDLLSLVTLGQTTESLFLDFKHQVDRSGEWQTELAQDVSQFANTWGGCLLIGVAESKDKNTGLKVAARFTGVSDPDRVRESVEQAITNKIVPSTLSRTIDFVRLDSSTTIVAVNVPASRRLVYTWDGTDHGIIRCAYRTNHGKARMNPDEVERHMMNSSRAAKLAFDEARKVLGASQSTEVHGGVWFYGQPNGDLRLLMPSFRCWLTESASGWFQLQGEVDGGQMHGLARGSCTVNIPYDVLRSVWVDPGDCLALLLSVRLVQVPAREPKLILLPM